MRVTNLHTVLISNMTVRWRTSFCHGLVSLFVTVAALELFILNTTILYTYVSNQNGITGLLSSTIKHDATSILENMFDSSVFTKILESSALEKSILNFEKSGGALKLMQNTVERVMTVTEGEDSVSTPNPFQASSLFERSAVSFVTLDVSGFGEVGYLIRRMKQRKGERIFQKYRQMVVDVGANDGFLTSNSFNFIQLGWDAILVEPQESQLSQAQERLFKYTSQHSKYPDHHHQQTVILVHAALTQHDGTEDFILMDKDTQSHVRNQKQWDDKGEGNQTWTHADNLHKTQRHSKDTDESRARGHLHPNQPDSESSDRLLRETNRHGKIRPTVAKTVDGHQRVVRVPTMTVRTLAEKYNIPSRFALLSIDAEGATAMILHQWIDKGFRPAYIVYENLHNEEPMTVTTEYLYQKDYRLLVQLGWNCIFEHQPSDGFS